MYIFFVAVGTATKTLIGQSPDVDNRSAISIVRTLADETNINAYAGKKDIF